MEQSQTTGSPAGDALAALLGELKERSGLSYGALAKRLHLSTSTLHRYCNGTVVPTEFAPLDRLARACRATPQEMTELHRRWILADGTRRGRAEAVSGPESGAAVGVTPVPDVVPVPVPDVMPVPDSAPAVDEEDEPVAVGVVPETAAPGRGRRGLLVAAVATAAVLGAVALSLAPFGGAKGGGRADGPPSAGGAAPVTTGTEQPDAGQPDAAGPATAEASSPAPGGESGAPSPSASGSPAPAPDGAAPTTAAASPSPGATASPTADPLKVATRSFVYDNPCYQHFLVNSPPQQVGPPAGEQDAPRWAAAYGAVASGEQRVALTVQGTGKDTVVLEALHVRVLTKGAPLAWNDYVMGDGCGGDVESASFDVDLDAGSPTVAARRGQRDFPRKVSESDPEVLYVTARTRAHDVRWELALDWSSGGRKGTVRVNAKGTAFRTSAGVGRPGYSYPPGSSEWGRREG
ncbi:helix-turn-helix domain-containing protein [Kitasatospora sp. NPDC056651]|uniref:helix-turn-helix domain-containing protein n=1 Tax=Kitasatospora sp. NPDC056651 TaxID=3345892 RepID=UPI003679D8E9